MAYRILLEYLRDQYEDRFNGKIHESIFESIFEKSLIRKLQVTPTTQVCSIMRQDDDYDTKDGFAAICE